MSTTLVQNNPYEKYLAVWAKDWVNNQATFTHAYIQRQDNLGLQDHLAFGNCDFPPNMSDEKLKETKQKLLPLFVNSDAICGLRPLHVAVMIGNLDAARILLQTGVCDVNVRDFADATPLHHAAVKADLVFMNFLKENGAHSTLQDCYGGTADDVYRLCHHQPDPAHQRFHYLENGVVREGNGDDFKRLTGAIFLDDVAAMTTVDWVRMWFDALSKPTKSPELILNLYSSFLSKPPKLYLDHHDGVGYILRAGEDILPFTVIGEALGEIDSEEEKRLNKEYATEGQNTEVYMTTGENKYFYSSHPKYHYFLGGVNGYRKRGLMAMMPSSFPNVMGYPLTNLKGRKQRYIYLTIESVKKGDVLALNYEGEHDVKGMSYAELRSNELVAFFQSKTKESLWGGLRSDRELSSDLSRNLEEQAERKKIAYLLCTPTAMVSLLLTKVVSCSTVAALFKKQKEIEQDSKGGPDQDHRMMPQDFFQNLSEFIEVVDKLHTDAAPMKKKILDACGRKSTLELLELIVSTKKEL